MISGRKANISFAGMKIKLLRKQKGLSMKELARLVGTSQQQIDRLEKGQRRMTIDWLERISKALGANMKEFLPEGQEDRKTSATVKAKVIGSVENGFVKWFNAQQIYPVVVGRPHQGGLKLFGLVNANEGVFGFPAGSELIFAEFGDSEDLNNFGDGLALFQDQTSNSYYLSFIKAENARPKAVLVKSIRNEVPVPIFALSEVAQKSNNLVDV